MPLIAVLVVLASTPWFLTVLIRILAVPVWRSLVMTAAERRELVYQRGWASERSIHADGLCP
jgi:hypothetical protein